MSYGYGAPDWMSVKWPGNDPMCQQPIFSPCINDPEDPFEERFGNPAAWSPSYISTPMSNAYQNSLPILPHAPNHGINWNSTLLPDTLSVYTGPVLKPAMVEHITNNHFSFSEEAEDEDDCEPLTDECQTATPETLSPSSATKNYFKPAWKSPLDINPSPSSEPTSPRPSKRAKRASTSSVSKESPATPPPTRRRSQRKPSLPAKTNSYIDSPTSPSSPEVPYGDSKTKKSHNLTEKKYRNRLNGYFDSLLAAIPKDATLVEGEGGVGGKGGGGVEKKVSKGEVLVLALERIQALEKEVEVLRGEKAGAWAG